MYKRQQPDEHGTDGQTPATDRKVEAMSRTYVVTGAASGIGKATRELLLERGHTVIGVDIRDADVTVDLSTAEGRACLLYTSRCV